MEKTRIAIGADGHGTTLQAIVDACMSGGLLHKKAEVTLVFSNNKNAFALERAKKEKIPTLVREKENNEKVSPFFERIDNWDTFDLYCLTGMLVKVPEWFVKKYYGHILNSHPAPLYEFGGKKMYGIIPHAVRLEFVRRANKIPTTCTCIHLVDEEYDKGPIFSETWIGIKEDDTPESLQKRLLPYEHALYVETINAWIDNNGHLPPVIRDCSLVLPDENNLLEQIKEEVWDKYLEH